MNDTDIMRSVAGARLAALVEYFVDDDTCSLDHHGYCHHHHGGFMEGGCWVVQARSALAAWEALA